MPVRRNGVVVNMNAGTAEGPHGKLRLLNGTPSRAVLVKFLSLSPKKLVMWYDDGRNGIFEGKLNLGQTTTTNSYEGHVFYFTLEEQNFFGGTNREKGREVFRVRIKGNQSLYIVEDVTNPPPKELRSQSNKELAFTSEYLERTGILWRHYFGNEG